MPVTGKQGNGFMRLELENEGMNETFNERYIYATIKT